MIFSFYRLCMKFKMSEDKLPYFSTYVSEDKVFDHWSGEGKREGQIERETKRKKIR